MKRATILLILLLLSGLGLTTAPVRALAGELAAQPAHLSARTVAPDSLVVSWSLPGISITGTTVAGRPASLVSVPGLLARQEAGRPELPMATITLAVAPTGAVGLKVLRLRQREIAVEPAVPSRGHLDRLTDPAGVPRVFGPGYAQGAVWPAQAAELGRPFLVGDRRGVTVRLQPVRYDAARGVLIITEELELAVTTAARPGVNEAGVRPSAAGLAAVQQRLFANAVPTSPAKSGTAAGPERMLIVGPAAHLAALDPLIRWKTRRGIEVLTATPAELGGSAAGVAQRIADLWAAPGGLSWVVLAGDQAQVPTRTGTFDGSDSDTRYALVAGDDLYPDLFVSRLPARNADEAALMAARIVAYERTPAKGAAAAGYGRASGVASMEGTPADDVRADALRGDLLGDGFAAVDRLYERDGASAAEVRAAVEDGRSLINYLGHGSGTGWGSVPFHNADVAALQNTRHWPWIIDVSCSTGEFARDECFAEAWLRAGTVAAPTGAVAMLAASSLVPWTPPTIMQAAIVEALTVQDERDLGSLVAAGQAALLDLYGGLPVATQVLEQFNLFGDASLQVRTRAAGTFQVKASPVVDPEAAVPTLTVDGPVGAVVALSAGAVLYARGVVAADGTAVCTWLRTPAAGTTLDLTVTAPEMTPWEGVVQVTGGLSDVPEITGPVAPRLLGNHPNPFNPATVIAFELARAGRVTLTVHDLSGRRVAELLDGPAPAGRSEVAWQGRDAAGRSLASGVYLYRLITADGAAVGRMTLVK